MVGLSASNRPARTPRRRTASTRCRSAAVVKPQHALAQPVHWRRTAACRRRRLCRLSVTLHRPCHDYEEHATHAEWAPSRTQIVSLTCCPTDSELLIVTPNIFNVVTRCNFGQVWRRGNTALAAAAAVSEENLKWFAAIKPQLVFLGPRFQVI